MRYAGIDPGLSGALACVGPDIVGGACVIPLRTVPGPDGQDELDATWLRSELDRLSPRVVALERVQGFGGVSSAFKLGQSYGTIITTVLSLRIRLVRVRPQTWQAFELPGIDGRDELKKASVARVRREYPELPLKKAGRCKPDDQSDAILLAHYCRGMHSG